MKSAYERVSAALSTLTRDQLEFAIRGMWLSMYSTDDVMDADRQWDASQIEDVASALEAIGLVPGPAFDKRVRASRRACGVIQVLERECLYEGKNPRKLRMLVQEVGENSLYNEISVSFHVGKKCVADICLGLSGPEKGGEARILTSINSEPDEHIVAIYPERKAPDCVDMEGA